MEKNKTNILIVEDYPLYANELKRVALIKLPESNVRVKSNGLEAIECLTKESFDLVITDIGLPDISGIDLIRILKNRRVKSKILVTNTHYNNFQVCELLSLDVNGILHKCDNEEVFGQAILSSMMNVPYYSNCLTDCISICRQKSSFFSLTDTELSITKLIGQGKNTAAIANICSISLNTVNSHKKHIFQKFEVHNVTELISKVYQYGLM